MQCFSGFELYSRWVLLNSGLELWLTSIGFLDFVFVLFFFLIHNRYELMTDCWKEEPRSRPSFYQLIEKLEVIMQRDAPYLDLNKHNEDHPYYNVPPEASGD